jgi:hypothetical protein
MVCAGARSAPTGPVLIFCHLVVRPAEVGTPRRNFTDPVQFYGMYENPATKGMRPGGVSKA